MQRMPFAELHGISPPSFFHEFWSISPFAMAMSVECISQSLEMLRISMKILLAYISQKYSHEWALTNNIHETNKTTQSLMFEVGIQFRRKELFVGLHWTTSTEILFKNTSIYICISACLSSVWNAAVCRNVKYYNVRMYVCCNEQFAIVLYIVCACCFCNGHFLMSNAIFSLWSSS